MTAGTVRHAFFTFLFTGRADTRVWPARPVNEPSTADRSFRSAVLRKVYAVLSWACEAETQEIFAPENAGKKKIVLLGASAVDSIGCDLSWHKKRTEPLLMFIPLARSPAKSTRC